LLRRWTTAKVHDVLSRCKKRGVELKWFGAAVPSGYTSRYDSWRYADITALPKSDQILAGLVDMRVPLTFSIDDCSLIARIIREEVSSVFQQS